MSEWKTYKLEDIATKLGDGLHGTPKYDDAGEYYFINGSNLVNGKIVVNSNTKRVTQEEYNKYKKDLSDRSILLGINGTIGNVALYNNEKCVLGKSACYINVDENFDKQFVKYVLLNDDFQNHIKINATGTTIKNVGLKLLREYEVLIPSSKEEQSKIATILSSLDDKIESNSKMNETLETMAQTIFKEWFIRFKFPKFNGEFIDGLPKGWRMGKLSEVLEIKYGKDYKHLESGNIPLYGSGGIMKYVDKAIYDSDSILIPRKGTLSNLFYLSKPFWSVDTMFYTKFKNEYYGKYLFYLLKTLDLASMDVGSAVPSLTTVTLNNLLIIIPTDEVQKQFWEQITPMFDKMESNISENEALSQIRDSLLPKLMTGKLEVKA